MGKYRVEYRRIGDRRWRKDTRLGGRGFVFDEAQIERELRRVGQAGYEARKVAI